MACEGRSVDIDSTARSFDSTITARSTKKVPARHRVIGAIFEWLCPSNIDLLSMKLLLVWSLSLGMDRVPEGWWSRFTAL